MTEGDGRDGAAREAGAGAQGAAPRGLTGWLVRRFVPDANDVRSPRVRDAYGRLASVASIVCNVALCAAKALVGVLAGSVSIVADAVNNLSDAASNVVSLLGFKLASRPADAGHPYGHGRFEYLSGMVVSALVIAAGAELVMSSVRKVASPEPTSVGPVTVAVLVASMLVKLWMARFNRSLGRAISSETLVATAVDARNDVITTAVVLAASVVGQLTGFALDAWAGVAVGAFVAVSGVLLLRDTANPLLGSAPDPELVRHIHDTIMSYPGVLGTHDLMVHDYGPGRRFASAHVEMAAEADVLESHDTLDRIEQDFKANDNLIMTLHMDPIVTDDPSVRDLRHWVEQQARTIDRRISVHDLRCTPGPTHTNVIFDCARPPGLAMSDDELKRRIAQKVQAERPELNCVIHVDDSYVSADQ